jgi:ADP-dependent NAD(P)H-hydrate dehydratase
MSTPAEVVTTELLRDWPLPEPGSSKHSRGHVFVVGGARSTPGAVRLAGLAALRVGGGVLALAVDEAVATALAVALPEASVLGLELGQPEGADALPARLAAADAVLLGPGLDDPASTRRLLRLVAGTAPAGPPLVLDAFALGVLADEVADDPAARDRLPSDLVLTPNPDEARRLLAAGPDGSDGSDGSDGADFDDAGAVAVAIARRYSAVVAYQRCIADSSGRLWVVRAGNPGLGTSGSGDVLAGALTGLLARGASASQAAGWATYLHAVAGDRLAARIGRLGFLARELLGELPPILTELEV